MLRFWKLASLWSAQISTNQSYYQHFLWYSVTSAAPFEVLFCLRCFIPSFSPCGTKWQHSLFSADPYCAQKEHNLKKFGDNPKQVTFLVLFKASGFPMITASACVPDVTHVTYWCSFCCSFPLMPDSFLNWNNFAAVRLFDFLQKILYMWWYFLCHLFPTKY